MGNKFFTTNFVYIESFEEEEEENGSNFLNNDEEEEKEEEDNKNEKNGQHLKSRQPSQNKPRYNFYLNKSFLAAADIEEDKKYKLKQIYAIKRINFIIKKTKEFLYKKKKKKNSIEELKISLKKNQTFQTTKSKPMSFNTSNTNDLNIYPSSIAKKNLFSYNNIINKEINEKEQNNIRLVRKTVYSNRYKKLKEGFHKIKLGENSELYGKYSKDRRIYITKTYFDNNDMYKCYNDITKALVYGIYYYYKIGCIYEGYWENNKKADIGIEKRWDGTKYEGEYKDGKKNGIGIYTWEDNSIYFGEWLNNNINGFGVFKNSDKSKYQGQFILNKRNGYGELTKYKSGTFYFGNWNNNKRKGFGVEFTPRNKNNSKIYVGFWNGKYRHGFGMVLNKEKKNENIYGLWRDNKNIKVYKNLNELTTRIYTANFSNYIPFFIKSYDEYEQIIKKMIDSSEFIRNYFS